MKKLLVLCLIIVMIIVLVGCTISQPNIGVMNMELVLKDSQRAKELQQELSAIGNELEKRYKQQEEELSEDKRKEKQDKIYQEYLSNKQRMEQELNQEINQVIVGLVKDEKLDIVISKKAVYYGGIDITEQLIEKLDKDFIKGDDGKDGQS